MSSLKVLRKHFAEAIEYQLLRFLSQKEGVRFFLETTSKACVILNRFQQSLFACEQNISGIDDNHMIKCFLVAVTESGSMFSLQEESCFLAQST